MPPDYVLEELDRIKVEGESKHDNGTGTPVIHEGKPLKMETKPPRTSIRFNLDEITVYFIKAREDMSLEEFHGVWYQLHDYSTMSSMNRLTVKIMRQQGHLDNEPDKCIRGLEHRLKGQNQRRKQIKLNAIDAVLNEQTSQRKFGAHDPHTISDVYKLHTVSIAAEAYRKGLNDEEIAKTLGKEVDMDRSQALSTSSRRRSSMCMDEDDLKELQELDLEEEEDRFQQQVLDGTKRKKGGVAGAVRKVGTFIKRGLTPPRRTRSSVSPTRGVSRTYTPPRRVKSDMPVQGDLLSLAASLKRATSFKNSQPESTPRSRGKSPKRTSSPKPRGKSPKPPDSKGSASPMFMMRKTATRLTQATEAKTTTRPARRQSIRRPSL